MLISLDLGLGIVCLYLGAEWLVRGSSALALRLRIPPLLVGLTVVAYGTSAPELFASTTAALQGRGAMAIANAVGSNILNIGLILGLTVVILPLRMQSQVVKRDAPVMVAAGLTFWLVFFDERIARWEAVVFLVGLLGYTGLTLCGARGNAGDESRVSTAGTATRASRAAWQDIGLLVLGIGLLAVGAHGLVSGALALSALWGWNEAMVGLTVVAAGTSLPELAACLVAAARKQGELAIGNILGSCIFNLLAILGVAGTVAGPLHGSGLRQADVYVMLGLFVLLLPFAWTGFRLQRWEGAVLLLAYGGYLFWLWPK